MNAEQFQKWIRNQEDLGDMLEEQCELIDSNFSHDGDWSNYIEKTYSHKYCNIIFKHSYKESSAGNCCDVWDEKYELINGDGYKSILDVKVDILFDHLSKNGTMCLNDEESIGFKNLLKEGLIKINKLLGGIK